jgi:hypothetical protein
MEERGETKHVVEVERIDTTTDEGKMRLREIIAEEHAHALLASERALEINRRAADYFHGRRKWGSDADRREGRDWRAAMMTELCSTFHVLEGMPGVSPWDPDLLDQNARGRSPAEKAAIAFVLKVWNGDHKWRVGRFDAVSSMAQWDLKNRAAFEAWVRFPWWP